MLHDLIKAATRNLEPGADPEKDWLKYADDGPCFITDEEKEEAEFIELDEEDEYEECECEETLAYANLETTANDLGYDDSLECIGDSEILEEFITDLALKYGCPVSREFINTDLSELEFIYFDEHLNGDVTVEVELNALIEYLNN